MPLRFTDGTHTDLNIHEVRLDGAIIETIITPDGNVKYYRPYPGNIPLDTWVNIMFPAQLSNTVETSTIYLEIQAGGGGAGDWNDPGGMGNPTIVKWIGAWHNNVEIVRATGGTGGDEGDDPSPAHGVDGSYITNPTESSMFSLIGAVAGGSGGTVDGGDGEAGYGGGTGGGVCGILTIPSYYTYGQCGISIFIGSCGQSQGPDNTPAGDGSFLAYLR